VILRDVLGRGAIDGEIDAECADSAENPIISGADKSEPVSGRNCRLESVKPAMAITTPEQNANHICTPCRLRREDFE